MKKIKEILFYIYSSLLFSGVYVLFVLDRLILSISFQFLSNFETWAELHLPEAQRDYKAVKKSFKRVMTILFIAGVVVLFTSCVRKEYICDCDYIDLVHGEKEDSFPIEANSKKSAEDYCLEGGGRYVIDFECKLR